MRPAPDFGTEDALIPLSALQHYIYCPRQCALIHVERQWAEDGATTEGKLLHARVDSGGPDRRGGVKTVRGLAIRSLALGVVGKADAVEFHGAQPVPIEYKRGRPKAHRADEVQLCAQALCLEEMFETSIPEGALFYGELRRRVSVPFDADLRTLTATVAREAQAMIAAGTTPAPVFQAGCKRCSLNALCQPERLAKPPRVDAWLARQLAD